METKTRLAGQLSTLYQPQDETLENWANRQLEAKAQLETLSYLEEVIPQESAVFDRESMLIEPVRRAVIATKRLAQDTAMPPAVVDAFAAIQEASAMVVTWAQEQLNEENDPNA